MQTADVAEINRVLQTFQDGTVLDGNERRDAQRFVFTSRQTVAPYSGKEMPRASDFRQVPCHDVSAGGMSFYWDRETRL